MPTAGYFRFKKCIRIASPAGMTHGLAGAHVC